MCNLLPTLIYKRKMFILTRILVYTCSIINGILHRRFYCVNNHKVYGLRTCKQKMYEVWHKHNFYQMILTLGLCGVKNRRKLYHFKSGHFNELARLLPSQRLLRQSGFAFRPDVGLKKNIIVQAWIYNFLFFFWFSPIAGTL